MNQLFFKVKQHAHGKTYEIYFGDPNNIEGAKYLGYVSQAMDGLNRPISSWMYEMPNGKFNLRAGRSMQQAAIRLAHKNGVALDVKA